MKMIVLVFAIWLTVGLTTYFLIKHINNNNRYKTEQNGK